MEKVLLFDTDSMMEWESIYDFLPSGEGEYMVLGTEVRWNGPHSAACDPRSLDRCYQLVFGNDNTANNLVYLEDGDIVVYQAGHDNWWNPSRFVIRKVEEENVENVEALLMIGNWTIEQLESLTEPIGLLVEV